MPGGDIELLRYRSLSDINADYSIRRAHSEACFAECRGVFPMLKLSKTRITVGDSVTVYWDIHENCSSNDWIGLFDLDYPTSLSNYLDCKQRGVTGARRGAIKWVISRNVELNNVENRCIFKYIYANTGSVRAISPTLFVHNPYAEIHGSGGRQQANIAQDPLCEISVSGLSAFGLKKNIFGKPSPYVKLSVIPSRRHFRSWKHHHGQIAKTSSQSHTIDPNWQNEEFVFVGSNDDVLEVEVRNKFSGTRPAFSRFLGKLSVPLSDVFHHENVSESVINKTLCKRTPSDRIQGRIRFIVAPLNATNRAPSGEEERPAGRENRRPSDLNVLSSHGGVMTNPALRSSAPDLLRPSLETSPSGAAESQPASPISPFTPENNEGTTVNRRRNLPREMRPFSEFYSEEFVPLDPEISSPRRNIPREERTSIEEAPSRESVLDEDINHSEEPMETLQNGEVDHDTQQTVQEHDVPTSEPPERLSDEATGYDEMSGDPHENDQHPVGSQESLDILESEGEDVDNDTHQERQPSSDHVNSVSSMRTSVGSIELTEDSPLRILEESEQALDEEATFSPPNLDDSDELEEAEEGAYGYLYGNPNDGDDGDDEMDSEHSTLDDDLRSSGVISVDSWTYEHSRSGEPQETASSVVSPPRYTNSSRAENNCSSEENVMETSTERELIGLNRSEEDIGLPLREDAVDPVSNDSQVELNTAEINEGSHTTTNNLLFDLVTPSLVQPTQEQFSPDVIQQTEQNEAVAEDVTNVETHRVAHRTDRSPPQAIVRPIERTDNQRLDLSSVAFPMEEGEPDCMDFTSVQNATSSQMVMDVRTNRSGSLVDTKSNSSKPLVKYNRSQSLVEAAIIRNESIVDARTNRNESIVDARTNRNESIVNARTNRNESLVEARTNRNESIVDTRRNRSGSLVNTRTNRDESIIDTRANRSESFEGLRSNRNGSSADTRSNRSESLVETRSNHVESLDTRANRSQSLASSGPPNDVRSNRGDPAIDSRSTRRQQAIVSFSRSDDSRSSTRSEGQVSFIESVPVRPPRRPKHLSRSMSDTRGTRLNHRPERPERDRRRRTETEPRASVRYQASEPYHRASLSDPVVIAVPVSADSPTSRSQFNNSTPEAIFVASALPSTSVSVTPIPSPTLDSDNSSPRSRDFEGVFALPVANLEDNSSTETRAVLAAVSPPRETTTVTPVPSPTAEQSGANWSEVEPQSDGAPSLPPAPSTSQSPATGSETTGAIPKPSPAEFNRENISKMLRTYVRSAQTPQRPPQTEDPRRREEESIAPEPTTHSRNRPPRHESVETANGSAGLPAQERGRPPSHEAAVVSRRRSSRQQRQRSHERTNVNPVHLQIQDGEHRSRRGNDDEPLPPNWERGVDSHGRVYYIDHAHRTTTWSRPTREAPQNETSMNEINTHWQSLDRRYESFRRTLRGRNRHSRPPLPEATNQSNETTQSNTDTTSRSRPAAPTPVRSESLPTATPTTTAASTPSTSSTTPATPSTSGTPYSSRAQAHAGASSRSRSSSTRSAALLDSPAVKFITRPDFVDFIKNSGVAGQYYFQSQMLKLIISKVRAEPANFEKYRHQVELVRFLNQFADTQSELPPAWDKKVDQNGRLYFIDHNTRTTTFIDPRLPHTGTNRRHRAGTETEPRRSRAPPPRPPPPRGHSRQNSDASAATTLTYNQQVVGFLSQPNIDEIIGRKHNGFARNMALKANIRRVKVEGERTLERLSNNVDFVMLLSLFEDQIMSFVPPDVSKKAADSTSPTTSLPSSPVRTPLPLNRKSAVESAGKGSGGASGSAGPSPAPYRRDFEAKVRSFHRQLYHKGYGQGPNKIKMTIRRDRLLEDAYDQIMKETARSLQRNRLEITFVGEEGLDYGGPAREFFFLISRQIFNPYYGLFEYSANDTYTVQVSPVSLYVDNSHEWFRFCGRIIGLVIIHQHLLDAFFTRTYYKALLRSPCDLSDVESLDALFHQSMTWVIENDIEDVLDLTFSVSEEIFGQVTERELIPGGKDIAVTEENKSEYVNEMVKWRVERGVSEQMESIVRGFNEVIDPNLMRIFDARELELVISGTADIDIKDWRRHTEYRSGFHDGHKVVKWFWKAVASFDNEQRLRLLQFVTGTSSIPYEGFAALRGSTGPRKFSIERWGDFSKLPRAHTCFNRLDLPVYRSYEELLEKLTFAVEETGTFSIQ